MSVTGFIAELNPLHNGHKRVIDTIISRGDTAVCALGGNFAQRGEPTILSKQKRCEAALRCGVDLVVEIPVPWSMSTAQNFALGGVSQLAAVGCENLCFGSECGDLSVLLKAAELEEHPEYHERLANQLKTGISFATARENVAKELGYPFEAFEKPNDTLAVEYIMAAKRIGWNANFIPIKREGAAHDADTPVENFISASLLREYLKKNQLGFAERYMPLELRGFLKPEILSDATRLETAILAVLRSKAIEDFRNLPDISEGIENKLVFSVQVAQNLEDLYRAVKSKRYPLARVRRMIFSAFLGIDSSFFGKRPPYVRVLGFSKSGEAILKNVSQTEIPVITRVSQLKEADEFSALTFSTECRVTDLYALTFNPPQVCGNEYKMKLLKSEDLL